MATTVETKLATMKKDCEDMVAELNAKGAYRSATQLQGLLMQVANAERRIQQDTDLNPPEVEGP